MEQSTIALIILASAIVLYCTELIPLYITSILAALAMVVCGIIEFDDAFSSLGSSTIMLLIGMSIMGKAISDVGIGDVIGRKLAQLFKGDQRAFIIAVCLVGAAASIFINGLVMMTIMMSMVDCVCSRSNGKLKRKNAYLPMGIATVYGCIVSSIGATAMMNVSAQLAASEYGRGLRLFEPALVTLPAVAASLIYISTLGYRLSDRLFTFDECEVNDAALNAPKDTCAISKSKMVMTCLVFAVTIILFLTEAIPYGATALIGACVLIVSGCVSSKVINEISWSTVFLVAGSIGLGTGVSVSGAGEIIGDAFIRLCGALGRSPYLMCCVLMLTTTVISNFMSNNAAVTIMCPLAFAVARGLDASLLPFALACGCGANLAVSTPVACGNVSVTTIVGYRFKDYLIYGGIINVIAYLVCCLSMYVVFFA